MAWQLVAMICYNIDMKILLHFLSLVLGGAIFVGVLYVIISKAVSTAAPESATKASSVLHPHRMAADAPYEMRNESRQ